MRILWDCRSVAPHRGGIGRATAGWLEAFLNLAPPHWTILALFSSRCPSDQISSIIPGLRLRGEILSVDAGLVAPVFEQCHLPVLLERQRVDLYFNPCFTLPAIKTTRFQASVIHDVVFFDRPEWVDARLGQFLGTGTDLSMRRADAVFTVSDYSRSRLKALAGERAWTYIDAIGLLHPILEKAVVAAPRSEPTTGVPYLLYLGAMERKKGIEVLLDAMRILAQKMQGKTPHLILAGMTGGQPFELQEAVARRGLKSGVSYLGAVDEPRKIELLRGATVFVFPSLYEGFGIPPLEAMALGTPVVAARTTSLPEILGDAAAYAEPKDAHDLARVIEELLENSELRSKLSRRGPLQARAFQSDLGVSNVVQRFERLERML